MVIKFRKDRTDGIKLFSKRGSEADFTFLATDTSSPYNDSREKLDVNKPEPREYYAFFIDDYEQVGQQSDIMKIVVP